MVNVSQRYDEAIANKLMCRGVEYYHFPLDEEVNDIGWENIKKAVKILLKFDKEDKRMVVHCISCYIAEFISFNTCYLVEFLGFHINPVIIE